MWIRLLLFHVLLGSVVRLQFLLANWMTFSKSSGDQIALAFIYGLRFDLFVFGVLGAVVWAIDSYGTWRNLKIQNVSVRVFLLGEFLFYVLSSVDASFFPFLEGDSRKRA